MSGVSKESISVVGKWLRAYAEAEVRNGNGESYSPPLFLKTFFLSDGFNPLGFNRDGVHKYTNRTYDLDGYDSNGFTRSGWNVIGVHRDTRTLYSPRGLDIDGYDELGWRGQYNAPWNGYSKEHWLELQQPKKRRNIACEMAQLPKHKETGIQYDPDGFNFFGVDENGNERS